MESLNYFPKLRYLRFGIMLKEMEKGVMECTTGIRPCQVIQIHRWDLLVLYKVEYLLGCFVICYWTHLLLDAYLSLYRAYGKTQILWGGRVGGGKVTKHNSPSAKQGNISFGQSVLSSYYDSLCSPLFRFCNAI